MRSIKTYLILMFLSVFTQSVQAESNKEAMSKAVFKLVETNNLLGAFNVINGWRLDMIRAGKTLLMHAIEAGDSFIVRNLIQQGADIHARDYSNVTVLHYAVTTPKFDINFLTWLLNQGTHRDINTPNLQKTTPLMHAVENHDLRVVKLLIEHGAKVDTKNAQNDTPLTLAHNRENSDLIKLLKFSSFLQEFWPDTFLYQKASRRIDTRVQPTLTLEYIEAINMSLIRDIKHPVFEASRCEKLEDTFITYLYSYRLLPVLQGCWSYLLKERTQEAVLRIHRALESLTEQNWMSLEQYEHCEKFFSLSSIETLNV